MNFIDVLFALIGVMGGFGLGWMMLSSRNAALRARIAALEVELATAAAALEHAKAQTEAHKDMEAQNLKHMQTATRALTEKEALERQQQAWLEERDALHAARAAAQAAQHAAEKELALIRQGMHDMQARMQDWEKLRAQMEEAAKASIMDAGGKLSSKLLEDHKREAEAAKKETEERLSKTTHSLFEQFKTVAEQVGNLKEQHKTIHSQFNNITRMLSTPHGAGNLSEIGLENDLKAFGLLEGRDFAIQYTVSGGEGQGLRPDCVVYLPQDSVMVIDSKSSKLLGEFADIDTAEKEREILDKLLLSMNGHLKKLSGRNYEEAIRKEYASAGRSRSISTIWNVMYVPSESIIEKLLSADAGFRRKCAEANILLAGPAALHSLLLISARQVELARQSENYNHILESVRGMVDRFAVTLSHLGQFSKQYRTAAGTFEKVTADINRSLLPRLAEFSAYGITSAKSKSMPLRLPGFEVRATDDALTIEGHENGDETVAMNERPAVVKP